MWALYFFKNKTTFKYNGYLIILGALCVCVLSCIQRFANPGTADHQAPLSLGSSRQEYWSGLLCPTTADLPDSGIKPAALVSPALLGGLFTTEQPGKHTDFSDIHNS